MAKNVMSINVAPNSCQIIKNQDMNLVRGGCAAVIIMCRNSPSPGILIMWVGQLITMSRDEAIMLPHLHIRAF